MESLQIVSEPSEVLGGHLVSLSSGDIVHESGLIFAHDALSTGIIASECNNDEIQTYMSVPVQMVQDSSYVVPLVLKNSSGNTFLIDPRQCGLLSGETGDEAQPQYIITPGVETGDCEQPVATNIMGVDMDYSYVTNVGNVVLGESPSFDNNVEINQPTVLHLGGQVIQDNNKFLPEGMCIDMSQLSIVTSNGVLSYVATPSAESGVLLPTNNAATHSDHSSEQIIDSSSTTTQPDNEQERDSKKPVPENEVKIPSNNKFVVRRGRGRPKRNDIQTEEVDPPVGKPPFHCDTCGYEAALWGRLKRHKQSHLNEKPHKCQICPVSFNVEANLTLHMATHDQDQLKCPECHRAFTRVASLRSHLMLHEREDNLFCTECGDEFALQYQLDSHVMEHQEEWVMKNMEKIYECPTCQRQFTRSSALKEHLREHLKVKHSLMRRKHDRTQDRSEFSHKCSNCAKVFQKPSQLLRHMRIHTGEKPFSCEICKKSFNQKGSLQIHMTKHNGEKPYPCEFCSAKFSQKGNLRAHIQRVHSIPEQGVVTFRCSECPCLFKKLGSLNSHMGRVHRQEDESKELKSDALNPEQMMQVNVDQIMAQLAALEKVSGRNVNSELDGEVKAGTGTKSHSQTLSSIVRADASDILQEAISKSGLKGKSDLDSTKDKVTAATGYITLADKSLDGTVRRYIIRQRKVGRVRWHQCSYCCKEFKKPSDLVRHIRVHTHEKPFKCPHCFRAFSVKSTLTAHIRTHGNVKEYTCTHCDKKFSSTSSLKVHQRLHNGERPFACSVCNRTFRTSGHRQSHWLSHCDSKGDEKEGNSNGENGKKKRKKANKKVETEGTLPEVLLQEPIILSEEGLIRSGGANLKSDGDSLPRLHSCTQCNSAFRKSSHLKMHLRIHSGERPFQCNVCKRSFATKGVLKTHVLTHQSVKAFVCSVCSNTFSTHGSLKRHMYRHDDSRPFMCPYCHKTFKHKLSCKNHMQTHKYELARAAAQQPKELNEQQFVVTVEDGYSSGDIIAPDIQNFSEQPLNSNDESGDPNAETVQLEEDKLLPTSSVITHTLLADASGTITLPATLTQASIREIEETLNQQLSSHRREMASCQSGIPLSTLPVATEVQSSVEENVIDVTAAASASEAAHAEDVAAAANLAASENVSGGDVNRRHKGPPRVSAATDLNTTIFSQAFDQQTYDSCEFPSITLQGDQLNLTGIEQGATLSANMEAILPQSCVGERRRNRVPAEENEGAHVDSNSLGIEEDLGEALETLDTPVSEEQTFINETSNGGKDISFIRDSNKAEGTSETFIHDTDADAEPSSDQSNCCEICNKIFEKVSQLKLHFASAHGKNPKPHVCAYCGRNFATASGLKLHERNHTGGKSFVCEHCTQSFASSGSLARHMTIHSGKRPFQCLECSASFRTLLQFRRHSKSHDPSYLEKKRTSRKVPAIILSEEQTSALAIQSVDMVSSVSEKILIASAMELNEENKDKKDVDQEPLYPNRCEFCTKSFRKPSDLVRHVRIHTGERPFRCSYCTKSFTVKSTLDSHLKTHMSGLSKMFPCHVCNLRFATKGTLKVHMRLHTGSRPFKCSMCHLRFRTSGHRKAHMHSHAHSGATLRTRKVQNRAPIVITTPEQEAPVSDDDLEREQIHQIVTEDGSVVTVDAAALLAAGNNVDGSQLQLQINDLFLQQLQFQDGGNVVIEPSGTVAFIANNDAADATDNVTHETAPTIEDERSDEMDRTEPQSQALSSLISTIEDIDVDEGQEQKDPDVTEVPNMHFEIHTDEHGQIVNIQQTLGGSGVILANIGDFDISDVGKVSIDTSQLQILNGVEGVNVDELAAVNGFVTLDISNIIVAPSPAGKGRTGKARSGSTADTPSVHACSVCNKVFSKPSQLERHVRIHTGERPFPCSQCWKAFNQKNALEAHMKRHTGERPFRCPYCDYAFTQRGNLKTHIGRAHPQYFDTSSKKKKNATVPKPIVDDVSLHLDLQGVVSDLFPQMQSTAESEDV